MTQDKDGFMWFATDAGLSRFDGTHFRNFNMTDGLPEIEILKVFADSRGRVWIIPFKNSICYYYKGKIYTNQNDPQLRRVKLNAVPLLPVEADNGDLLFASHHEILVLRQDTGVEHFHWPGIIATIDFSGTVPAFYSNDSVFHILNGKVVFRKVVPLKKQDSVTLLTLQSDRPPIMLNRGNRNLCPVITAGNFL